MGSGFPCRKPSVGFIPLQFDLFCRSISSSLSFSTRSLARSSVVPNLGFEVLNLETEQDRLRRLERRGSRRGQGPVSLHPLRLPRPDPRLSFEHHIEAVAPCAFAYPPVGGVNIIRGDIVPYALQVAVGILN